MKNQLLLLFSILYVIIGFPFQAQSKITVSKMINDHMVLQRDQEILVWGWADKGEKIVVSFNNKTYRATPNKEKAWLVKIPAMKAGGPYSMLIAGKENKLEFSDILIGDVWICSGQSNMEWIVRNSNDAKAEIKNARDSKIRHFKVPLSAHEFLQDTLAGGAWDVCSSETAGNFTAVGYFFAKELRKHQDVPIGLINTSWGGSRIEPWMSAETLGLKDPGNGQSPISKYLAKIKKERKEKLMAQIGSLPEEDLGIVNNTAAWAQPAFPDSDWKTMELPVLWEAKGYNDLNGIVWFRKEIILTEEEAKNELTLSLGKIDDSDKTYVNGKLVGSMEMAYNQNRIYKVPSSVLNKGYNTICVWVEDTGGGGGIYGPAEELYFETNQRKKPLDGQWKYKIGKVDLQGSFHQNQIPTLLFNFMIHPILKYKIKGALWYQGESNAGGQDAIEYQNLFPTMINDWRKRWNCGDFPFLWVQLANWRAPNPEPGPSDWALLRESQSNTLSLKNTAEAVIIDIGEADDIHPRNKQDVGLRLSLAARKIAFGEDIVYSGPRYESMNVEGNKIRIKFSNTGSGLIAKGKYGYLKAFSVAGKDGNFVWAKALIEGDEIVVWSDRIKDPIAVRYAWADNPDDVNLYNLEGLPASPFRTDTW